MNEITEKQYQERIVALNREVTRLTALIGTTNFKSAYEKQKAMVAERDREIGILRQEIKLLKDDLQHTHKALQNLRNDRDYWWSQLWYKRMWFALTKSKYL